MEISLIAKAILFSRVPSIFVGSVAATKAVISAVNQNAFTLGAWLTRGSRVNFFQESGCLASAHIEDWAPHNISNGTIAVAGTINSQVFYVAWTSGTTSAHCDV